MFLTTEINNSESSGMSSIQAYGQLLERLGVRFRFGEQSLSALPMLVGLR